MLDLEEEMVSQAPLETPDPPAPLDHLDKQGLEGWVYECNGPDDVGINT